MNEKVQKYLESKLLNGEEVLWYGQPPKGFLLRRSDWFYIPSSLIFAFGVAFVDYKMLVQSIYFGLFLNSLFMLISIYVTLGRFYTDFVYRKNSYYILTNLRVLIPNFKNGKDGFELSLSDLKGIYLNKKSNEYGNITFGAKEFSATIPGMVWPGCKPVPWFENVEKSNELYRLILEAQKKLVKNK